MTDLAVVRHNEPLAPYTSLKVGGASDMYVTARGPDEALAVLRWADQREVACRWLGGGSNLLVAEAGLDGLAARYLGDTIKLPTDVRGAVLSEAGRSFPNLARVLARAGWGGLEWAANVPGTVGGAVVNNAGAFGACVADVLVWAELVRQDGALERLTAADLGYAYRTSRLKRGDLWPALVIRAAFAIQRCPPAETVGRVRQLQEQRTATQPRQLSAGSVFANPPGDFAGRLVEAAGLKGCRLGGAEISSQHANFIVNVGGATPSDVYGLMRRAQDEVWRQFGCWLKPEIELIGRWTDEQLARLKSPP